MKVTPLYDLSWYIKWIASLLLILAIACRASGLIDYDIILSFFGMVGWGVVGWLWHDRALLCTSSVSVVLLLTAILRMI
jgi:hypothetical protein